MPLSADRLTHAYAQSITFDDFVETSQHFTAEFRETYAGTQLDDRDHAVLRGIRERIEVLAIVEDWCPDVVANLPILARVADETDKIRLHVLIRSEATRKVADAYPFEGRSHIPTYVFHDHQGVELGVIVERTDPIRERVNSFLESFFQTHPELNRETFPAGLTQELKSEITQASLRLRRGLRDLERSSFVDAIAALVPAQDSDPVSVPTVL